jgi:hypothetical protein
MITMMEHPKHGRHPATGHEIAHLKALGWTECAPKAKPVDATPVAQEVPAAPRQKRQYNRKQG